MKPLALVVENDAGTRKLLAVLMVRFGFEVDAIARATDALLLLERVEYDVAFIEVIRSSHDGGVTVLEWLATDRSGTLDRTIVLSSAPEAQLEPIRRRWPTVGIIRKPFDLSEIGEAALQMAKDRSPRARGATEDFCRLSVLSGATTGLVAHLDGHDVEPVFTFGYPPDALDPYFPMKLDESYPLCTAIRQGQPVWLTSMRLATIEYPVLGALWVQSGTRALAAVPLIRGHVVVGAVGWSFREQNLFTERNRLALIAVAETAFDIIDPDDRPIIRKEA